MNWEPWIEIVESNLVPQTLESVPEEHRELIMIILACAKWHPSRGSKIEGVCSFCWTYRPYGNEKCDKCLLVEDEKPCLEDGSLYTHYLKTNDPKPMWKYLNKLYRKAAKKYGLTW